MALAHKAAFQALLDYLIIWCFGLDSMLHREDPPHPHPSLWFSFYTKSASTLVFELVVWHKAAWCPVSIGSIVQFCVYCCWGKRRLLFGIGFKQWDRFHELYSVVSLTLGNRSEFQAVNCGWYMKSFFGTQGLGVAQWRGSWWAFVHVTGFSFFNHSTSFIFSQCEITTAWQNIVSQRRRKEWEEQRHSFTRLSRGKYISWCLMFFKVVPHHKNPINT